MQGHLLSSSYCVRLGRVRFRMENKATGRGGRGARGDSRQRLVHTPPPRDPDERGVGGRDRAAHTRVRGQGGSQGKGAAPRTLLSPLSCVLSGVTGDCECLEVRHPWGQLWRALSSHASYRTTVK